VSQIVTKFVNNLAITEAKIANAAVTTAKVANDAIVEAKIANAAVTTNKVADNAIVTGKIANEAVTSSKIAPASVTTTKIDDNAVTTSKVADNAINGNKIKLLPDQPLKARNRDDDDDVNIIRWYPGEDRFILDNIHTLSYNGTTELACQNMAFRVGGIDACNFATRTLFNEDGIEVIEFADAGRVRILPKDNTETTAIEFVEAGTNGYGIQLRAPATLSAPVTLTLPNSPGGAGQVLQSDGSGNLQWVTVSGASVNFNKETFVLTASDISNGYVDLAEVAVANSIVFLVRGAGVMLEGASYDYSVDYTGGNGGKTRITWLNDLAIGGAAELVAGDVLQIQYQY
jgi:hypothetical protein